MKQQSYIPALAYRSLTGLYDPLVRITTRERRFKAALLQQARLRAGQQVLDLACGTATLTIAAKRMQPLADITGADGDPDILARARVKAAKAEAELKFDESLSQHLPYGKLFFSASN